MSLPFSFLWAHLSALCCVTDDSHNDAALQDSGQAAYNINEDNDNNNDNHNDNPQDPFLQSTPPSSSSAASASASASASVSSSSAASRRASAGCGRRRLLTKLESEDSKINSNSNSNNSSNSSSSSSSRKGSVGEADRGGGVPRVGSSLSERPEDLLSLQIQLPAGHVYHVSASYSATPNSLVQEVESISGIPVKRQVWTCLPGYGPFPEIAIGEGVTFGRLFIESFGKAPLVLRVEDEANPSSIRSSSSSSSSSSSASARPIRKLSGLSGVGTTATTTTATTSAGSEGGGRGGGSASGSKSSDARSSNASNSNGNSNGSSNLISNGNRRKGSSGSVSSSSSSSSSSGSGSSQSRSRKSSSKRSNSKLEASFPAIAEEEHEHDHDHDHEQEQAHRGDGDGDDDGQSNGCESACRSASSAQPFGTDSFDGKTEFNKSSNNGNTENGCRANRSANEEDAEQLDDDDDEDEDDYDGTNGLPLRLVPAKARHNTVKSSLTLPATGKFGDSRFDRSDGEGSRGVRQSSKNSNTSSNSNSVHNGTGTGTNGNEEEVEMGHVNTWGGTSSVGDLVAGLEALNEYMTWEQDHQSDADQGEAWQQEVQRIRSLQKQGSQEKQDKQEAHITVQVAESNAAATTATANTATANTSSSTTENTNKMEGAQHEKAEPPQQQQQQQQVQQRQEQEQRQQQHSQDQLQPLHPSILASSQHTHHHNHHDHPHHPTLVLEDDAPEGPPPNTKHRHTVTAAVRHGHCGSTSTTGSLWTTERVRKSEANLAEMAKGGSAMEIVSLLASPALMGARDANRPTNGLGPISSSSSSLEAIAKKLHGHSSKASKAVEAKESVLSEESSDLEEEPPRPGNLWKRRGGVSAEASGEYNQNFVDWTPQIFEKSLEDAEDILEALRNFPPLSRVSIHVIKALAATVEIVEYPDGACICTQGEMGHSGYVILEGDIDVFVEEDTPVKGRWRSPSDETSGCAEGGAVRKGDFKRTMTRGRFFGEHTMLWGFHRGANIYARGSCRLGVVNRHTFFNLAPRYEMEKRLNREALLRKARVFETLDDDQLAKLVDVMVCLRFAPGEEIIRQGERGQDYFIILEGECLAEVLVGEQALDRGSLAEAREAGALQEHARYSAGDSFGERGFISGEPRGATVTAVTPVAVLRIKRSQFRRLLGDLQNLQAEHYVHDPRMTIAEFYGPGDERGPRGVVRRVRAETSLSGGEGGQGKGDQIDEAGAEQEEDDNDDEAEEDEEEEEEQEEESLPAEPSSSSSPPRLKKPKKTVTEWFAVYRPTSRDAIAKMLSKKAVGKGLNVKGKSAKKAHLSGYVPFLQIHTDEHKALIEESPSDTRVTVFYQTTEARDAALWSLQPLTLPEANLGLIGDPTIKCIDDYRPLHGLQMHERVLREAYIERQTINFLVGWDTGRESVPSFQDMNLHSIRGECGPRVVLFQFDAQNAMNPHGLLMAYAEDKVKPVVSDFDTFTVGSRSMEYREPLPKEQWELALQSLKATAGILKEHSGKVSWTDHWIEVLRKQKEQGQDHYSMPPYGFGDPLSQRLIKEVVSASKETGAIRHGAECFNFGFPQELDHSYLVVWQGYRKKGLPWQYHNEEELRAFLLDRVAEGYIFPLNAVWVVRDPGWYDVFQALKASPASASAFQTWYPPESGLLETIEDIHAEFPTCFSYKPSHGEVVHRLDSHGSNPGETFQFQKGWQNVMQELCNAKGRTESLLQSRAAVLQGIEEKGLDADDDEKASRQDQMQCTLTKLESEYFACKLGVDYDDDDDMSALERADLELFEVETDLKKVESLANATRVISRMKHLFRSRQRRAQGEAARVSNTRISMQCLPNERRRLAAQCTWTEDSLEQGCQDDSDKEKD